MANILVIDDDSLMRDMLKQALSFSGHKVVEAPDGKTGMNLQQKTPFDLIITDIFMPEQEGLETIMSLRRGYPELKIIAYSGGGSSELQGVLKLAGTFGANHTFEKPFDLNEMVAAIDKSLGQGNIK